MEGVARAGSRLCDSSVKLFSVIIAGCYNNYYIPASSVGAAKC